jgi:hypothetical protein
VSLIAVVVISLTVVIRIFVECIVGQMHIDIAHVGLGRSLVSLRAKSCKCHLVQVDTQRTDPVQEDINSEIVLEVVD